MKKMIIGKTILRCCGLVLLVLLTAVACTSTDELPEENDLVSETLPPAPTDDGLNIDEPIDMSLYSSADLVFRLEDAGATVRLPTEPEPAADIFSVPGQYINVGSERLQVYVYDNPEQAGRDAASITDEGYTLEPLDEGGTAVSLDWESTPHFYLFGNVIVLYVGEDAETLNLLESVIGPPLVG